jgi:23S rRNA (adenine2503-C2)-methyltransferase
VESSGQPVELRSKNAPGRPKNPVRQVPQIPTRYDLDRDALSAILTGEPSYRVKQVWDALHTQAAHLSEMTTLPKALRERLEAEPQMRSALTMSAESASEGDDTIKWLWTLEGGATVETVLMHYPDRSTVCVSTQAGCAMACSFCATGQAGFSRQLTVGEIVEQVMAAKRRANQTGRRLGNVVFMGMGEPLANYGPLWSAIERLHTDVEMSARHLTVSTVGVVPGILKMAEEPLPVNLAVSLHAANDRLRDELVPLNKTYPLSVLMDACETYLEMKGRRLSFEWALIDGVNDTRYDADELSDLARPLGAHVNLIPLNPTPGYAVRGTSPGQVRDFRDHLEKRGVNATIRRNRGTEIDAACGQLAANQARSKLARSR